MNVTKLCSLFLSSPPPLPPSAFITPLPGKHQAAAAIQNTWINTTHAAHPTPNCTKGQDLLVGVVVVCNLQIGQIIMDRTGSGCSASKLHSSEWANPAVTHRRRGWGWLASAPARCQLPSPGRTCLSCILKTTHTHTLTQCSYIVTTRLFQ